MDTTFARVIEDHLELKRRNAELDNQMPLTRYRVADPFENHPLFKSEEQARIEDTLDGVDAQMSEETVLAWPAVEESEADDEENLEDSFWGRSRDFDWGD